MLEKDIKLNEDVMKELLGVEQPISMTLTCIDRKITDLRDRFVKQYGEGVNVQDVREYFIDNRLLRVRDNCVEIYHTREPYEDVLNFIDNISEKIGVQLIAVA